MSNIKVYTTPTCAFCHMTKQFLQDKGAEYEEIDVSTDQQAAQEIVEKTGQMGVPVTQIDDQYIIGFDKAKLEAALS